MKNLNDAIDRQMLIDELMLVRNVPIITENTLKNIQKTTEYKSLKEATKLQISRLKVLEERRKNKSAARRNLLLYLLTLVSSIKPLQILAKEFDFSFKYGLAWVLFLGIVGLLWWIIPELRKNKAETNNSRIFR
jgi:hypothetical protein